MPSSGPEGSTQAGPHEALRFRPIFKPKVWGGRRLETELGKALPGPGPYGECWELSDFGEDRSVVEGGPWHGVSLGELVRIRPREVLGRTGGPFPLLIKTIDASRPLSVQVHPSGEDGGAAAKSEAWVILDVLPGARIVHGLAPGVKRDDLFRAALAGRGEEVEALLGWKEVRPGDVVYLPAGTIHALGAGVLLLEVQQSSDTTYRIHDWNRPGLEGRPRELHLEAARAVRPPRGSLPCPCARLERLGPEEVEVLACPHFRLGAFRLEPGGAPWRPPPRPGFVVLCGVEGQARVRTTPGAGARVRRGEAVLVPAAARDVEARAEGRAFTGIAVRE